MVKIIIRDFRNGEWSWVYNSLTGDPHLTPAEKCIYASVASWGGCDSIHPSFEEIAKRASLSIRVAKSAIKKLKEVGYLDIKSGGGKSKPNEYQLLKMPKGCKICTVSNGAQNDTQTVHKTTANGAKSAQALYKDKELYKEEDKYPSDFKEFWKEYPKKIEKADALREWKKLCPSRVLVEKIISAVQKHKQTKQWKEDSGDYIIYPSRFLKRRRWEDELPVIEKIQEY